MSKDVRAEYHKQYDKANTVGLYIKLNKKTDADILAALAKCDNKQGFIKELIREDLKRAKRYFPSATYSNYTEEA